MDILKKKLADLKKDREGLQSSLAALYAECGSAQFEYVLHNTGSIPYIAEKDFELWKGLREVRIKNADTILNIKTAHSRQNELKVFYDEIDKTLRAQKSDYAKVKKAFMLLFFETYSQDSVSCLNSLIQDIQPLKEKYAALLEEQKKLEQQKNDAHFFKKLTISPQLMALKSKISGLQKTIDDHIISAADTVLSDSVLTEIRTERTFPEPLEHLYCEFTAAEDKRNEIEKRKETLIAEQEKLKALLENYGVSDTPQKRIAVLNNTIKQTDEEISEAEMRQGVLYADIFYTAEGSGKPDVSSGSEPDVFKSYLTAIAEYRTKLEQNTFNTEYVENEIALAGEIRKLEALQKAVAGYKDGIAQYERLINAAEQDIARSEMIKADFEAKKSSLLPHVSPSET